MLMVWSSEDQTLEGRNLCQASAVLRQEDAASSKLRLTQESMYYTWNGRQQIMNANTDCGWTRRDATEKPRQDGAELQESKKGLVLKPARESVAILKLCILPPLLVKCCRSCSTSGGHGEYIEL